MCGCETSLGSAGGAIAGGVLGYFSSRSDVSAIYNSAMVVVKLLSQLKKGFSLIFDKIGLDSVFKCNFWMFKSKFIFALTYSVVLFALDIPYTTLTSILSTTLSPIFQNFLHQLSSFI